MQSQLEMKLQMARQYLQSGRMDEAEALIRQVLAADPDNMRAGIFLAVLYTQQQKYKSAIEILDQTCNKKPSDVRTLVPLAMAYKDLGKFDEATVCYQNAIKKQPDSALLYNNLGSLLSVLNDPDGAISCFRNAVRLQSDHARAHSNLLMTMNYLSRMSQNELYSEALQFEAQHARGLCPNQPVFRNPRELEKVLRIGYVSSDFRTHSVAYFTRKLFGVHDRSRVEVFCYANVMKPDDMTSELEVQADHWLSIAGMRDEDVVNRIKADQIDILIDLGGHTVNNRILIFARRPAPIQVTWLGYPNTTGMACMDYRLTDAIADPPGIADSLHSEELVRLPHGFLCYQADQPNLAVAEPPCLKQGHITYGSFNSLPKLIPDVIRVWSKILKQTPGSRLVLKSWAMLDEKIRERCLLMFVEQGLSPDRLDLLAVVPPREEHLATYSRIDIGLDPFPYNGTTTTCEALLMGVPVICLRGDRHSGRVGASIMHHVGLPELVADSEDEYVDLAQGLASDTRKLISLRNTLRPQMRQSELMDVPLFTKALENAYRQMWIKWCNS